jgi:hypothetical protein
MILTNLTAQAYQLFNDNPFQGIMKASDKFFRWAGNRKKKKKLQRHPCNDDVTQTNITLCQDFLQTLQNIGRCFDYRRKGFKTCNCFQELSEDNIHDASTFLVALANQEKPLCNTQLKGMMAGASQNQVTKARLKKKYWQAGAPAAIEEEIHPD